MVGTAGKGKKWTKFGEKCEFFDAESWAGGWGGVGWFWSCVCVNYLINWF